MSPALPGDGCISSDSIPPSGLQPTRSTPHGLPPVAGALSTMTTLFKTTRTGPAPLAGSDHPGHQHAATLAQAADSSISSSRSDRQQQDYFSYHPDKQFHHHHHPTSIDGRRPLPRSITSPPPVSHSTSLYSPSAKSSQGFIPDRSTFLSSSHQGMEQQQQTSRPGQMSRHYSYSAMARLSIAGSDGGYIDTTRDNADMSLPPMRTNEDGQDHYGRFGSSSFSQGGGSSNNNNNNYASGPPRSPASGSSGSSPNLVSVREMDERERMATKEELDAAVQDTRNHRLLGIFTSQGRREDGLINLPPLRPPPSHHANYLHSPSSPNHNGAAAAPLSGSLGAKSSTGSLHNTDVTYLREGSGTTGPQRTGRPHSQSVSSMTSPYNYSATSSTTSLLLPSPSGLSNLRPSFTYSPPRSLNNGHVQPVPTGRPNDHHARLERHISSSSLPGDSVHAYVQPHRQIYQHGVPPPSSLPAPSHMSNNSTPNLNMPYHHQSPQSGKLMSPPPPPPQQPQQRRGNIERLFRAATTRKKRSASDVSNAKNKDGFDDPTQQEADVKPEGKDIDPTAVRRLAHLQCEQRRRE